MGGGLGLVGLGVMGENLARNIASKGYSLTVYNRTREKTDKLVSSVKNILDIRPSYSLVELVEKLEKPRQIVLMVEAGKAVETVFDELLPLLSPGDVVFDCGNSFFRDTERRQQTASGRGVLFMGVGVSGGEEGALKGPSIMVGGPRQGYDVSENLWKAIAAKADGESCAGYMGSAGSGHFVKMVHNGIEYALLQLIAETYDILHRGLGLATEEVGDVFREWSRGMLSSYLLEIAADALRYRDEETGKPLVELVLDKAEQKGTGRWTVQTAAELGVPTPSIDAAVSARNISALKETRVLAARKHNITLKKLLDEGLAEMLHDAYLCSAVVSYVQGLHLIDRGSKTYGYGTVLDEVLKVWRNGCIIRAALLKDLRRAIAENGD
ncbi:MAG: NADP-dependent phosphogluconate dehydrogenase, partial [Candidatus Caldarchaeum sp.]|nr:NADP-dependent phosphogluconate dehydrogenase [Candidatus Caldarchaeum sp.]MDW8436162.1 NADP-dependent phosphogluconate dehydrogenase [Candidatus Caldarchaeum sp.]